MRAPMMRRRLLMVAVVTSLVLPAVTPGPTSATVQTCRGLAATIVGTPGAELTGTNGPDVVVTGGAASVTTGDGDDLVCTTDSPADTPATAPGPGVEVHVGAGNDTVDTTAEGPNALLGTSLGDGDDIFQGGRANDSVDARDQGHDTVRTGGGNDFVGTGSHVGVDEDFVDTGASGDQLLVHGSLGSVARLAGGGGRDDLSVNVPSAGRWVFDNQDEEVRHDGTAVWRFSDVEGFFFQQIKAAGRISFVGGPGDELLYVTTSAFEGARLGGGQDDIFIGSPRLAGQPVVHAGAGRDRLTLLPLMAKNLPSPRAELDLASGSLFYVDSKGRRTSMRVRGIEGAELYARTARITGGAGPDALITWGCDMVIDARAGNDNVGMFIERECGAGTRRTLYGGPGDDRLTGSALSDRLLGGPGDDHAHGGDGDDVCVAERVTACERCSPTGDPASFPLISLAGSRDQHPGHLRGRVDRQSVAATATSRSSAD